MNATPIHGWLARRRLGAAEALDALTAARRRAEKEPAPKKADTANPWVKILAAVVAVLVLAGTAVIATVVVGTQIGFYREIMKVQQVDFAPLPLTVDLPVFTPFATEGVVWMCTLMAVVLVILNRPSVLWTQAMWVFAGIQAFVNSFHAIHTNDDLLGGIVTGGLSISGPLVVHLFVIWVQHLRSGRTLTEARAETSIRWAAIARAVNGIVLAVLDHTVHPVTAARTISVWRTYRGISYSQAWFIASKRLRARTMQRYNTPLKTTVDARPETTVETTETHAVEPAPEDRAHGAVLAPERADDEGVRTPCTDAVDELLKDLDDDTQFKETVDGLLKRLAEGDNPRPATSGNDVAPTVSPRPAARTKKTSSTPVPTPTKKRGSTPKNKRSARPETGTSKRDLVADEYFRRVHAGEPVEGDGVNLTELARQFGTHRTTVSKTFRDCSTGAVTDPNPNRK